MAKMTAEGLKAFREQKKEEARKRDADGKTIRVVVGMGTCGIAAGAKATIEAISKAVAEAGLGSQVVISQTGCMGLCYVEPTVEVVMQGMPRVIYGKVNAATGTQIVKRHLVEKALVSGHIFDRPAADVVKS